MRKLYILKLACWKTSSKEVSPWRTSRAGRQCV
uniref:Uncharacterized protein n=1 Tax=Anguilla anguilla TaxID=7936 RepID=A0A0E9UBP5_ANGAN